MSITAIDNRQVLRDYLREFSGRPKTEEMMERLISDESLKTHIRQFEAAFSAYEVIPLLIVAEGDWLACRMTFKGVHTGEFAGIPSTGRAVSSDFAIFYRFENGRIVDHRLHPDIQDLVRQLTA
jgi:predicted ester cyclase